MRYIYEIAYITTNIIYILTIQKMFDLFFKNVLYNKKIIHLAFTLYFLSLSAIIFITSIPVVLALVNIIFFFCISLLYKSTLKKKLLSISFIYTIGVVIEVTSATLFGVLNLSGFENSQFNSVAILVFTRTLTLVIVYMLYRYKSSLSKDTKLPKFYFFAFFIVLFGTLYLFLSQLSIQNPSVTHILICSCILILVNVAMIILDEKIHSVIILEYERKTLIQNNEALCNQMDLINQTNESIKILKHDFHNHCTMLSNLYNNKKDITQYLNSLLENIEFNNIVNSGNFIIDSIINFKLRDVETLGIKLSITVNIPVTINIIAYDLTAVFSNLIDNSLTACCQSKEKKLEIKIISKLDNLLIFINNSFNGHLINENGDFQTTKIGRHSHGLGIISIKKILVKYDGEIKFNYTSDIFSTSVVIPFLPIRQEDRPIRQDSRTTLKNVYNNIRD